MSQEKNSTTADYWILDGAEKSYDLKEEIKAWGGYWNPDHKAWRIDGVDYHDVGPKTLRIMGLKMQRCEPRIKR